GPQVVLELLDEGRRLRLGQLAPVNPPVDGDGIRVDGVAEPAPAPVLPIDLPDVLLTLGERRRQLARRRRARLPPLVEAPPAPLPPALRRARHAPRQQHGDHPDDQPDWGSLPAHARSSCPYEVIAPRSREEPRPAARRRRAGAGRPPAGRPR